MRAKSLQDAIGAGIIDRKGLILKIFEYNARTTEARIQIRLARLQYERARIVLSSSEFRFDQYRGGGAAVGGAGEQHIELARRRLDRAISKAKYNLAKLQESAKRKRSPHSKDRVPFGSGTGFLPHTDFAVSGGDLEEAERLGPLLRADPVALARRWSTRGTRGPQAAGGGSGAKYPSLTVALAGYTNVGKTALARALCAGASGSDDFQPEDRVFATLDTKSRRSQLPSGAGAVVVDTVGFITDLPPELVASFRSTLGEVGRADVLVHVRDSAAARFDQQGREVRRTLDSIGAPVEGAGTLPGMGQLYLTPRGQLALEVWNKVDLLRGEMAQKSEPEWSARGSGLVADAPALPDSDPDSTIYDSKCGYYAATEPTDTDDQRGHFKPVEGCSQEQNPEWMSVGDYLAQEKQQTGEGADSNADGSTRGIHANATGAADLQSDSNSVAESSKNASIGVHHHPEDAYRWARLRLIEQARRQSSGACPPSLGLSASTGEGVDRLRAALDYAHMLLSGEIDVRLALNGEDAEVVNAYVWLFTARAGHHRPQLQDGLPHSRSQRKGRRKKRGRSTQEVGFGAGESPSDRDGESPSDRDGESPNDRDDDASYQVKDRDSGSSAADEAVEGQQLRRWLVNDATPEVRILDVTAGRESRQQPAVVLAQTGKEDREDIEDGLASPLVVRARLNPAAVAYLWRNFPGLLPRLSASDGVSARRLGMLLQGYFARE